MQNSCLSRLHTQSQASFNETIICGIFISVNAIQKFLSHESRFAFTKTVEIKDLCLQLKRSGTECAAQIINFLTSTVKNGRALPL